jgi:hypothetical protein
MTQVSDDAAYVRLRNATVEMRRCLRMRRSGEFTFDGCVVRWDTAERRIILEGQCVTTSLDIYEAVRNIANDVQFNLAL